jgi:NNP family nitrate/nitrite transporter-like MFS transporter
MSQLGDTWAWIFVPALFTSIIGGLLGDRLGVRWVIGVGILLSAVSGALRGIAGDFITLIVFMFLFGSVFSLTMVNMPKTLGMWFPVRQIGVANGITFAAFGVGGALSMMFSGSVISPAVGGWRNLMFLYGAMSVIIGILWLLTIRQPTSVKLSSDGPAMVAKVPFRESFSRVVRKRDVWLGALALLGIMGGFSGPLGYLPLYFEDRGMSKIVADSMASALLWGTVVGNIAIPLISDRVGLRRVFYVPCVWASGIFLFLIPQLSGVPLWIAVTLTGVFMGGGIPLLLSAPLEMKGIGPLYAGTAIGVMTTAETIGGFLSPWLGFRLADIKPLWAFIFWGVAEVISGIAFWLMRETGYRARKTEDVT